MTEQTQNLINTGTWSGALLAGAGALTLTEWLAIGGFFLAFAGFVLNAWFKIKMYRLEKSKVAQAVSNKTPDN